MLFLSLSGAQTPHPTQHTQPTPLLQPQNGFSAAKQEVPNASVSSRRSAGCTPRLTQPRNAKKTTQRLVPSTRAAGQTHLSHCRFSSALPRPQNNPGSLWPMAVISFQVMAEASCWLSSAGFISSLTLRTGSWNPRVLGRLTPTTSWTPRPTGGDLSFQGWFMKQHLHPHPSNT